MDTGDGSGSERNVLSHIEIVEVPASSGSSHSGEDSPTSGSNQHSTVVVEVDGGSGSSKHSGLVVDGGGGSSEDSDTHHEATGGSHPFEITPEFLQWWGSGNHAVLQPDVMDESESSKQLEINQDIDNMADSVKLRSSSSSSSSSSHSKEDTFQTDAKSSKPDSGQTLHASDYDSCKSEGNENATPGVIKSKVSGFSHESAAMESPPIQVMDRSKGYDPYRIPASVFETHDSSAQLDWSVASNDSLFSINVGSFSRNHSRYGEPFKSPDLPPFSPSMIGCSPYVISPSTEANKKSNDLERNEADQASPITSDTKSTSGNQNGLKTTNATESCTSSNVSHSSSMNSAHSFAFPILTDAARNNSAKGEPQALQQHQQQQQQQQQPAPEVTPNAPTRKSWFSWCCCSPCRWTCSCHYCQHRHRCCCYR